MSLARPGPQSLQGLPLLTEVIEMPPPVREQGGGDGTATMQGETADGGSARAGTAAPAAASAIDEAQCVERVLADLQRQTDLMLEYRLREALAPVLARLSDSLVRDVRQELAATLRDVVARAVSQELSRRRDR